ncbi:hypothetical protein DSCA_19430 [Desulfosarcina alkanivorans]|jgi:enoyl-CoA hydratase/carnithine racemase|uniref:Enoyl-CoA hydratase n=1 Tax=Desulfosarcina alkanivorans TaxID=571177 RepID=A0A5K7YHH6_9BACT|nr:enoyl-CoA hydratase-related protein [Desulfosarcina alkanivorans]BBO68013.1 hypothetical protein DSCA_19430 [Desulfosarcina alkanivorans]
MGNDVLVKEIKGHVGKLILNRPDKKNALSHDLLIEIHIVLEEWSQDENIRTVIITGTGNQSFSSGYDVSSIPSKLTPEMAELAKNHNPLEMALASVREYPYPTIGMLNGYAFGAGLNLALCCDIRIAADDVRVGMPPAKLGLIYHPEGLRQFTEVIGFSRTRELFFTADTYDANQAKEMGLIDYVVPRSKLPIFSYEMAERISRNSPLSLKGTKQILNTLANGLSLSPDDLTAAEKLIAKGFLSDDLKEGQLAFMEKRKPVFTGR